MPENQPARTAAGSRTVSAPDKLDIVVEMVRQISRQTDPQAMVSLFRRRASALYGGSGSLSLSRRGLSHPAYRITRSTRWDEEMDPWREPERLPLLEGGLLAELIYADAPRAITDLRLSADDPAGPYLEGARSLTALPLFDGGEGVNMVVRFSPDPAWAGTLDLADAMLTANLFGRATHGLLAARRLEAAYAELDHEMHRVAEIQRALLPPRLPNIPDLDIAVSYKTAARAGGDYYDFFDLDDGRWGILIADVSGHGTPAAVVMAMMRTMLHARCYQCVTAGELLGMANEQLIGQLDRFDGTFVTAFYGIYDPSARSLQYASAGHHPPLLVRKPGREGIETGDPRRDAAPDGAPAVQVRELDAAQSIPLAVDIDARFSESETALCAGDTLVLYTDGITDATDAAGRMYGRQRLLSCAHENVPNAQHIIDCVTHKLMAFTGNSQPQDDQTLVALRVL